MIFVFCAKKRCDNFSHLIRYVQISPEMYQLSLACRRDPSNKIHAVSLPKNEGSCALAFLIPFDDLLIPY